MIMTKETKNASKKSETNNNSNSSNISNFVSQEAPKKSTKNVCDCIDYNARGEKSIVVEDGHVDYFEVVEEVNWIDVDYY